MPITMSRAFKNERNASESVDRIAIGEDIRKRRRALGMTQHDLAERMALVGIERGYSVTTRSIRSWERGDCSVSIHSRSTLAAALETTTRRLFGDAA